MKNIILALLLASRAAQACENSGVNNSVMLRHMPQFCGVAQWLPVAGYPYAAHGVTFDGVHDYLTRDVKLTGAADSPQVTGSFWFRRAVVAEQAGKPGKALKAEEEIYSAVAKASAEKPADGSGGHLIFGISLTAEDKLRFTGADGGGKALLDATGDRAITDASWHHALFSFDLSNSSRSVFLDNAPDQLTVTTLAKGKIGFSSATETAIGADVSKGGKPAGFLAGGLADVWIYPGTSLDLSAVANREKFISDIGNPMALGSQGKGPTGSAPEVFLSGADTAYWIVNRGKGGGFTGHWGAGAVTQ